MISLVLKSLLTDDPERQKPHVHITHVRDGRGVRGAGCHQARDGYTLEAWRREISDLLLEHAERACGEHENVPTWLEARGLQLPDKHDATTPKTANLWLTFYGPTAFALGIRLVDTTGKTIASPGELPSVFKGFVFSVDLLKGRTVGAKSASSLKGRPRTGKYGAIKIYGGGLTPTEPDGSYLRLLKPQDVGKEAERVAHYTKQGVSALYLPPSEPGGMHPRTSVTKKRERVTVHRKVGKKTVEVTKVPLKEYRATEHRALTKDDLIEMWENWDQQQAKRAFEAHAQQTLERLKAPPDPVALPPRVHAELTAQAKTPAVRIYEVLRERVAAWKRPTDYMRAIDPMHRQEYDKLRSERRRLLREYRQRTGRKGRVRARDVGATFLAIQQRMKALEGHAVPTTGGGYQPLVGLRIQPQPGKKAVEVAKIDDLDFQDLGFDALAKPMSYLLSVGWADKTEDGKNRLSSNEQDAVMHEYENFIRFHAHHLARTLLPHPENKGDVAAIREFGDSIAQQGRVRLFTHARSYQPKETPSQSHNFALYVHDSLPKDMRRYAITELRERGKHEVYEEELREMPTGAHGSLLVPKTRPESPHEALHRMELHQQVADIFQQVLNPLQWLVLKHYLNIHDHTDPQAKITGGTLPGYPVGGAAPIAFFASRKREKATGRVTEGGGVKTWESVKEGVKAGLKDVIHDKAQLKEAETWVTGIDLKRQNQLKQIAHNALDKLRAHFSQMRTLAPEQRRALFEYAAKERLLLEGVRHRLWMPSESVPTLKVSEVQAPSTKKLEAQHRRLSTKMQTEDDPRKRLALEARQHQISARIERLKQKDMLAKIPTHHASRQHIVYKEPAAKFWASHEGLAHALHISLDYAHYRGTPSAELPTKVAHDRTRAEVLHRIIDTRLMKMTPQQLRKVLERAERGEVDAPTSWGMLAIRVLPAHWKEMVSFVLAQKTAKPSVKKAVPLVMLDVIKAFDLLREEIEAWELTRS